jgi:hypothetical protein
MKQRVIEKLGKTLIQFGFNPIVFLKSTLFLYRYVFGLFYFLKYSKDIKVNGLYPQMLDYSDSSGSARGHYFHQDIIVARWIYNDKPKRHVDIASRVDGFISHLAVFREVEIFDIRPLSTREPNIVFVLHDMMKPASVRDLESISCLHSIEHFGLGRYGDPLDVNGHIKGFENICSMLKVGGAFYFSTPVGPLKIEFNAHRIFSVAYVLENFIARNNMEIVDSALVDDNSNVFLDINIHNGINDNFKCEYGVLILKLRKL